MERTELIVGLPDVWYFLYKAAKVFLYTWRSVSIRISMKFQRLSGIPTNSKKSSQTCKLEFPDPTDKSEIWNTQV